MYQIVTIGLIDKEINDLKKELPSFNGSKVLNIESINDCLLLLSCLPETQLLIASSFIDKSELESLSSFLKGNQKTIPLLVLRDEKRTAYSSFLHNTPVSQMIKDLMSLSSSTHAPNEEAESSYFGVPLHYFYNFDHIFCDLYIRIRKSGEKDQFVKRILAHDKIDMDLIERLASYGVEYLYVPVEYKNNFIVLFMNKTMMTLKSTSSNEQYKVSTNSVFQQMIYENILKEQFGELVVEMAKASIQAMYETIKNNSSLSEIDLLLEQSSSSLNYRLNCVSAIVIHKILQKISWSTSEHKIKLTYACFFSDIFSDEPSFRKVHFSDQTNKSSYNTLQVKDMESHALKGSEMITKYKGLPLGLETLIREHHGDKRGINIKSEPDIDISPLSRILIIGNDFAQLYLEGPDKHQPLKIIRTLSRKYEQREMQKLLQILQDALKSP